MSQWVWPKKNCAKVHVDTHHEFKVWGEGGIEQVCAKRLIGVIKHTGRRLLSGHYVAYVKGTDGVWRLYNDAKKPKSVSFEEVATHAQDGYLYFFDAGEIRSNPSTANDNTRQ